MAQISSASMVVACLLGVGLFGACSGGEIAVGKTDQQIQKQTNGQPTGDGHTCSWQGTSLYAANATSPGATQAHQLGDSFKSLDACNDCSCNANGIMCTVRSCGGSSSSGSSGNVACSTEAKQCPDGSFVGRIGTNCDFAPCPATDCNSLEQSASNVVHQAIAKHTACTKPDDCIAVDIAIDCFDGCSTVMNKDGAADVAAAKAQVNESQCKQASAAGCTYSVPPCRAVGTPQCTNNVCVEQ